MGYSGHVPGGRDHFGSAAVAGSMEVPGMVAQRDHVSGRPAAEHSHADKSLSRTAAASRAGYQGHRPDLSNDVGESYWGAVPGAEGSRRGGRPRLDAWSA